MIHIVSGFVRTGTSAMMGALIAGGLTASWSEFRDGLANSLSDDQYHPNRSGLYEVPLEEYRGVDFPLQYRGQLIKVMSWGLDGLAVNSAGYRVVLMQRDPEEIRQSYEAFFDVPLRGSWAEQYEQRMQRAVRMLRNRADVIGLDVVQYRELVQHPERELSFLAQSGWPINTAKAAATIDPEQYRFRRELLTVGI